MYVPCFNVFAYMELTPRKILGWAGHIRIDGTVYRWLGDDGSGPSIPSNLTSRRVTPTRTVFQIQAGPMNLNVTFLSPIEVSRVSKS